jgi:alpha-1,3-rhamnosyl/mannosyltransferase
LRVAVDASRGFEGRPTGTERYANALIHALAARDDLALQLFMRRPPQDAPPEGVPWRVLHPTRVWTHGPFAAALRRSDADVAFVPAHVMPLRVTLPVVVTVHDLGHRYWPAAHTRRQRTYLEWSARRHVRLAARLVVDSLATGEDLIQLYGAPAERIVHAPLGVDARWRPAAPATVAAARHAVGLPQDATYLLHVGTVQPRKNLLRLKRAFEQVAADHPNLHLVLAGGRGWGAEAQMLDGGPAVARVHRPGYVEDVHLPGLYSGALAVVVPSLHEGFGLPALEAMACGVPVAVSGRASLPEVVGDAGLVFDPLDDGAITAAIRRLVEEPELRATLAEAGLERAAGFTWAGCAARVAAALHDGAGERGR